MNKYLIIFAFSCAAITTGLFATTNSNDEFNALIQNFIIHAESSATDQLYDTISPEYQIRIPRDRFIEALTESKWRLIKLTVAKIDKYKDQSAAIIISAEDSAYGRLHASYSVLYVKKYPKYGWRIQNFPFIRSGLPLYAYIPDFVENGIYSRDQSKDVRP